jgi:hypothetical protein
MGPYNTPQNQAAGQDLNIPGAGTSGLDNTAASVPVPQAPPSGLSASDCPSGVAGGLGPSYFNGGNGSSPASGMTDSGQGTQGSVTSIPDSAPQMVNQAPPAGDIQRRMCLVK